MLSRRTAPLLLALGLSPLAICGLPRAASAALSIEGAPLVALRGSAPLTVVMQAPFDLRSALRKLPSSVDEGPVVRLSIERVKAPGGTSIRVFVNLPNATADTPTSDFHYVGSLSVFEDPAPDSPGDDFLLDAGRAFKRLKKGDRLLLGDNVSVTLILEPGTAGTDVEIPVERVVLSVEEAPRR
jgi:hypothetical protein